MKKRLAIFAVGLAALVLSLPAPSRAAGDYYGGQQIRFIVGFSAGAGYDAYTALWRATSAAISQATLPLSSRTWTAQAA